MITRVISPAPRASLGECARHGYFFCRSCERVTEPQEEECGGFKLCTWCGSRRVLFCPPVDFSGVINRGDHE